MELNIELNTENLKERVKQATESIENAAFYSIQQEIVRKVSEEVLKGLTEKDHWDKDRILGEVEEKIMEKIGQMVELIVTKRLEEYQIERKVASAMEEYVGGLIDKSASDYMNKLQIKMMENTDD